MNFDLSGIIQVQVPREQIVLESIVEESVIEPVLESVVEEPVIESVVEEPVIESVVEEPVIESVVEEPVIESVVEEPVIESVVEEPVIESVVEEPVLESVVEEPVIESVVEEPVLESVVEEPVIESVVEEPVIESVVIESVIESVVIESVVEEPVIESVVEEPVIESVVEEPVVESVVEEPVIESVVEEPVIESVVEEPVVIESVVEESVVIESVVEEPVIESVVEEPVIESVVEEPVIESVVDEPVVNEPVKESVVEEPVKESVEESIVLEPVKESLPQPILKEDPIPKMIFIVPYRDREAQRMIFKNHMNIILEDISKTDYKIFFIHQKDNRTFNRGAMKNIGFLYVKSLYPNDYKTITLIFNDVDTMPVKKNLLNYQTSQGIVKHFYGYTFSLGGIVSILAGDFEKTNGFPNYWAWGYEDNAFQKRVKRTGLLLDRRQFYPILDKNIIQLNDTLERVMNRKEFDRYLDEHIYAKINDGYPTIHNLEYTPNDDFIDVSMFKTAIDEQPQFNQIHNLKNGSTPFKVMNNGRTRGRMGMIL